MENLLKITLTEKPVSNIVNRRRHAYRHGVVTTDSHPVFLKGQVIEIMAEEGEDYIARVFITGLPGKIEKKFVLVN